MSFSIEDCEYINFRIENHKVEFAASGVNENGVLISIPFMDDTPQCIKDKLNGIIYQEMNKYLETVECMNMPCCMRLNARMQIKYDHELGVQYSIVVTITDLIPEDDILIDKDVVVSLSSDLYNEFVAYCRYQLDRLLFSMV